MPRPLRRTCSAQRAVRGSRQSRVTSLGLRAMPTAFVFFNRCVRRRGVGGCSTTRACRRRRRARSDALHELDRSELSCPSAMLPRC